MNEIDRDVKDSLTFIGEILPLVGGTPDSNRQQPALTPEMIAEWPETYVRKCLLAPREGDILFFLTQSEHLLATIEGYAIIPMEMYERLTNGKQ